MQTRSLLGLSAAPFFLPVLWRLFEQGLAQPIGLLSDGGIGLLMWLSFLLAPGWMRVVLVALWALFQIAALELLAAMQRFPGIAACCNPLHWLVRDAAAMVFRPTPITLTESDLPGGQGRQSTRFSASFPGAGERRERTHLLRAGRRP